VDMDRTRMHPTEIRIEHAWYGLFPMAFTPTEVYRVSKQTAHLRLFAHDSASLEQIGKCAARYDGCSFHLWSHTFWLSYNE